jgi:ribosomal protein S18 acetylase RimI-like enzyme
MNNAAPTPMLDAAFAHLVFRPLTGADAASLFELHTQVVKEISSGELYRQSTLEDYEGFFAAQGLAIGVFDADNLVGFGMLKFPSPYAKYIPAGQLTAQYRSNLVGHLEECAVLNAYRKHGLHKQLTHRRLRIFAELGYIGVTVTVSPLNLASLKVQFDSQFTAIATAVLYGGYRRLILYRNLAADSPAMVVPCGRVDTRDHVELARRLDAGQVGTGLSEINGEAFIAFGLRRNAPSE